MGDGSVKRGPQSSYGRRRRGLGRVAIGGLFFVISTVAASIDAAPSKPEARHADEIPGPGPRSTVRVQRKNPHPRLVRRPNLRRCAGAVDRCRAPRDPTTPSRPNRGSRVKSKEDPCRGALEAKRRMPRNGKRRRRSRNPRRSPPAFATPCFSSEVSAATPRAWRSRAVTVDPCRPPSNSSRFWCVQ